MPFSTIGAIQLNVGSKVTRLPTGSIEERALFRVAVTNAKENTVVLREYMRQNLPSPPPPTVAELAADWDWFGKAIDELVIDL